MTLNFDAYVNSILNEGVVDDLFRNPENNKLTFDNVIQKFYAGGGNILGQGAYATTLAHKDWNYVLKAFHNDSAYVAYARYCYRNQNNPCVPKLLDKPRKIVPNYTRDGLRQKFLYYVKMEKLEPMHHHKNLYSIYETLNYKTSDINDILDKFSPQEIPNLSLTDNRLTRYQSSALNELQGLLEDYPWTMDYCKVMHDVSKIAERIGAASDTHSYNIMVRPKDNVLVVTDPLAGSKDHDKGMTDIYGLLYNIEWKIRKNLLKVKGGTSLSRNKIKKNINKTTSQQDEY